MLLPNFITEDKNLNRLVELLQGVLQSISEDNFRIQVVEGTTSGSADSSRIFKHNLQQVPKFVNILEGDVYIPKKGLGPKQVDVRSSKTSEAFTIKLIF